MLNAASYTTKELIHYASIDERYAPLLAERLAKEGSLPDDDELIETQQMLEEAQCAALDNGTKILWVKAIDDVIDLLDIGNKEDAISHLEKLRASIDDHDHA